MEAQMRKRILRSMGEMPSVAQMRKWEWIDDRTAPEGEPDGQFDSFTQWVNKASSWIGYTGAKCYDSKGRPCRNGGDMHRARDENAFPVSFYFPDRFAEPTVLAKGVLCALKLLAEKQKCTIGELRIFPGAKRITWEQIERLLGEGSLSEPDESEQRAITTKGLEELREYQRRALKASYV